MIVIHQRTDRQTDGRHAISIPRYALVHRGVKMVVNLSRTKEIVFRRPCPIRFHLAPFITSLETVILVTSYHSAASVFLNVLLLIGVFLQYTYITIVT